MVSSIKGCMSNMNNTSEAIKDHYRPSNEQSQERPSFGNQIEKDHTSVCKMKISIHFSYK